MSDNKQADIQLPGLDESAALLDRIYGDSFFAKMAELGHVPQTQEDAVGMLETAFSLDMVDPGQSEKQAFEMPYASANASLNQVLGEHGIGPGPEDEKQAAATQTAFALAHNVDVYKSVLGVKTAEAAYQALAAQEAS
jgi:hypothetical protein